MEKWLKFRSIYCSSDSDELCHGCSKGIKPGKLMMALMLQSQTADEKEAFNFHFKCFFKKQRLSSIDSLAGFERLRPEDQQKIKTAITRNNTLVVVPKGNKRAGTCTIKEVVMSAKALRDFGVQYSISGLATCRGCREIIRKDEIRCKKIIYDTEVGIRCGGQALWHHLDCFAKLKTELGWFASGDQLPGYNLLSLDDQKLVKETICATELDKIPELKKAKLDTADGNLETTIQKQSVEFFNHRDYCEKFLSHTELVNLLEVNAQQVPPNNPEILDAVAEILTFGALKKCPACEGQLVFIKTGYICTGNASEWVKCVYFTKIPARMPSAIPPELTNFFAGKKIGLQTRALRKVEWGPTNNSSYDKDRFILPKVERQKPPLYLMEIVILGNLSVSHSVMEPIIKKMGGQLVSHIHCKTAAIISTEEEIAKMDERMQLAKNLGIQVVPEKFLEEVQDGGAVEYIAKYSISDWGSDPFKRINQDVDVPVRNFGNLFTESVPLPQTVTLKVINGTAVDPKSGLEENFHVYVDGDKRYMATLNLIDILENRNSYYTLQVLEQNNKSKYYLFSSWGRIGTTIGDSKNDYCPDLITAVSEFERIYEKQTGNKFEAEDFKKLPGKYYPIDVDFGIDSARKLRTESLFPSTLPQPVQKLMKIIFDVNEMTKMMIDYDLDMEKMPLGKLSASQISKAMTVLTQMLDLIKTGATHTKFIGASNHFYSLIPHNFGKSTPPVLRTTEAINKKADMLQNLLELEVAYNLIMNEAAADDDRNPWDLHYDQLNTELLVVDPESEEFEWLERYMRNTHGHTHDSYSLEIADIFRVQRYGERKRFDPFVKMANRKMLWHGSRTTNFVGILSHGLRIAPPEAPMSGYMFGKGIYFADMVSKSANYCFTSHTSTTGSNSTTGLVLLCEVALGTPVELTQPKSVVSLPKHYHSVKGIGQTYPNPECAEYRDGVEIPLGIPITDLTVESALLYNEYIVYNEAQVNIKYLFNLKFHHY